ncbi:MAG: Spy/CpxP family protein refolding chaperone [Gammaproteobacteria bacterium]|nr:Spy/CpxP family protein refolding chaperone [Gammaproteobacteria bacterium]MBU0785363.1 Spy/CpxP family protein refolding chaperone [Gammaproteobacteria bacterium]MBU0815946.1 Spy/CpxP family protein refolding chaperone [Gammaproteobacteria bacterium]MBU1787485.1 Spy/CpxP family protein refolding chaperone [Gammaproteobacteria bacterium]
MKYHFKPLLVAGLLATTGFAAMAQGAPHNEMSGQPHGGHHRVDPAKMQAHMVRRQSELKAQLKLSPQQEPAWTAYTAAMTPPAGMMGKRPDHAELQKLPTPERLDKMQALRAQRMGEMNAAMSKRTEATKAFYAALSPEQQKIFDDRAMQRPGHNRGHGPRHGERAES